MPGHGDVLDDARDRADHVEQLQAFVDAVASGATTVAIDRVFAFDDIVAAHRYMEDNRATGKLVVRVGHAGRPPA